MLHANIPSLKNSPRTKTRPWLLLTLCLLMIVFNIHLVKANNVVVGDGTAVSCMENDLAAAKPVLWHRRGGNDTRGSIVITIPTSGTE